MEPILNVHERASSFVGRAAELEDLAARFERGARLVTLLAPGGMGKTRVAQRFAVLAAPQYSAHGAGGVWFCDLTPARARDEVLAIVAETLGIPREGAAAMGRALARRKRLLLVLDNCEHVVDALREVLPEWISRAPSAQILATSRAVIGVDGEELAPLAPLSARVEGADLFLQRARARAPTFAPQGADLERVRRIADRLDGIPLAIELAAARAHVLSLADIEARLEAPLALLVRRDVEGKHDSMRRAIADSVDQLGERERRFFAALSIFRGAFSMRGAERALGRIVPSVVDTIELLVGRSIVNATQGVRGPRFGLYEAIREYAAEELAARPDEREALHAAHAAHFASASDDHEDDAADLAAAHAWALAQAVVDAALLEALTLRLERSLARDPARRLDAIESTIARLDPHGAAPALLAARGRAKRELGRLDDAARDFERALATEASPAVALGLAEIVETQGDTSRALEIATAATALIARMPPGRERDVLSAQALARIGHVHRREARIGDAQRETERAVTLERALGSSEGLAFVLYEAAVLALFRGHHAASMEAFDEGLDVARAALESAPHNARLLLACGALTTGRGTLLQELGRPAEAIALHADAARIFADLGDLHREGSALYYWAGAYMETGALADAETTLSRALAIVAGVGVPRYEALICGALAAVVARRDAARADELLARADAAAERCAREGALVATLAIHRIHVEVARDASRDLDAASASARELAQRFECDDPRFALRALAHVRGERTATGSRLRVAADGAWFESAESEGRVDLQKRAPLRRIVAALARRRHDVPGDRLGLDELVEAGWPGEKMKVDAAANRVYVALATLRKLGLRTALSSGPGGYYLDPAVPLERAG